MSNLFELHIVCGNRHKQLLKEKKEVTHDFCCKCFPHENCGDDDSGVDKIIEEMRKENEVTKAQKNPEYYE